MENTIRVPAEEVYALRYYPIVNGERKKAAWTNNPIAKKKIAIGVGKQHAAKGDYDISIVTYRGGEEVKEEFIRFDLEQAGKVIAVLEWAHNLIAWVQAHEPGTAIPSQIRTGLEEAMRNYEQNDLQDCLDAAERQEPVWPPEN